MKNADPYQVNILLTTNFLKGEDLLMIKEEKNDH